ncbi:MAG: PP2C family protein-serine/threonine phosphatase [Marinilabiliaceae bacterium]|nr:SpoIIE family protein phosphatase [Bacteroidales bacterium]MDY4519823.1 SpoIIE family protein phosphatase [Bacteroidales bacterium]
MANDRNVVRLYKEKLNMLLDVAQTVNEDSSVADLMQEFESLLRDELMVNKILVFTLDEAKKWQCILQCNVSNEQRDAIDIERDLQGLSQISILAMADNPALEGFDAAIPLRHKYNVMGYVLVGDGEQGDGVSPTIRNLKFIQILANLIIVFIENKKMQQTLLRQEGLKQELALASRIQAGLIPPEGTLLQTGHTRAKSYYHPHDQVGGDYFDVMQLSPHIVGFCMADVSGKGVAAALLMSNFQAMMRTLLTAHCNLRNLVQDLNRRVCQNTKGEKFITLFVGRYNCLTGHLHYVNAGHLPPMWRHGDNVTYLEDGCIGLGMLDDLMGVEVGCAKMSKGDLIVTYTDGLIEVDEVTHVGSNEDKVIEILKKGESIDQTMAEIGKLADDTLNAGRAFDDTSVLTVEITKRPIWKFF